MLPPELISLLSRNPTRVPAANPDAWPAEMFKHRLFYHLAGWTVWCEGVFQGKLSRFALACLRMQDPSSPAQTSLLLLRTSNGICDGSLCRMPWIVFTNGACHFAAV